MEKRIFSSLILASFLIGCGGGGSSDGTSTTTNIKRDKIVIADVFPSSPKVALNGSLKLTPVIINDYTKEIKSSSIDNQIIIEWNSINKNIAIVDANGIVYGKEVGQTVIEAVSKRLIDGNSTIEDFVQIPLKVVNTMGNIAELSLSPTRATIDKNSGAREFDITAIDNSGVLTSLNQGVIEFNISNPQGNANKIIKEPSTLSSGESKVAIESINDRVGYVFITPIYRDKDDVNLTTTGSPLVVQVSDIPDATPDDKDPSKNLNAGKYLDLEVDEKNGKKELHVVHYDQKSAQLKYSYFNGTWNSENIRPATTEANSGTGAKVALSPFDNNYKKPIIVALENENIELWYKNNSNNWINKRVSQSNLSGVIDYNLTKVYNSGDKFLDIAVDSDNKFLYIAYFSPVNERIYLTYSSMSENKDLNFSENILTIDTANHVQSLSLALNIYNQPRIAYSTIRDNSKNDTQNGLFYASRNGYNFNVEKIKGTTGDEKGIVLKLDKTNKPAIIYYTPSDNLYYVERAKEPSGFTWTSSSISFNEPIVNITGIDYTFDHYNSPRVIFNSNSKIRYARRLYEKSNEWIVETPEESSSKFGEFKAIKIDSENRIHMVYTSDEDKWFKYWAEPIFFDYRRYDFKSPMFGIDLVN